MTISEWICLVAVCVVPVMAQDSQQQTGLPKDLPPSPLEVLAARPATIVVWSKMIGRLESLESSATLTVVAFEDQTDARVRRGLRIDLAHRGGRPSCDWKYFAWRIMCERANAAVYVEEERLEEVRDGIARGAAELRPFEFISRYGRRAWGQESTGLIVCGYQFSDRQPVELAELFTRAIAELGQPSP